MKRSDSKVGISAMKLLVATFSLYRERLYTLEELLADLPPENVWVEKEQRYTFAIFDVSTKELREPIQGERAGLYTKKV